MFKRKTSLYIAIFLSLIIVIFNFLYIPSNILSWDVFGYYLYLPCLFIYNDLGLNDVSVIHNIIEQYNSSATFYQAVQLPSGDWVMRYQMGMAILYSPAFFIGHLVALIGGYTADGFSSPYQYSVFIENIIVTIIGIFIMRKLLLKFFNEKVTAVVLIILVIGTNFFYHNAFYGANAMNHNYLFTLYALLIWITIKWYETYKFKYIIFLGLVIGIITLSRPPEIICVLIPVLWGIKNKASFLEKLELIKQKKYQIITCALIILFIGFLQLFYYKISTGNFLFYSYGGNKGEGFDFLSPYIISFSFSFRKGWLLYTPILIFSIIGFYFLYKRNKSIFFSLFLFFIVNLYIVSSWSTWWGGETFSQKNVIQSYAILAFPLGYFITYLNERKKYIKAIFYIIFCLLIILNLFQTWQILHGVLHPSRMSKAYYFRIFGKTSASKEDKKLLMVEHTYTDKDVFNNEGDYDKRNLQFYDFEDKESEYATKHYSEFVSISGKYSLKMDSINIFSPGIEKKFTELTEKDHVWIRASAYVYPVVDTKENPLTLVITFQHKDGNYKYRALNTEDLNLKLNEWNKISMDYLTPWLRSKNDMIKIYFWLRGKNEVYIDDFKVEVFERKY
ncbi:MAG: glycosyltransferase family 39 protein [Bacteroidales bacterium]|nr:glycosyltransferase family 39 protein [Bacteroidales bacterium]